jgi:phosphoribosylglycinamide formyltransferase-1
MQLGFLASNKGSSLRAIVEAIEHGHLCAEPRLVVSNNKAASALTFARDRSIPSRWIPTLRDPQTADLQLAEALSQAKVELVVLSGYLRKLGPATLSAYAGRILNIHPALLPRHGGAQMYGRRVHQSVLDAGDAETGASVHLVDDQYDHGPVLTQTRVPLRPGDSAETIERRVMEAEPKLFIETLQRIARGELRLPAPMHQP